MSLDDVRRVADAVLYEGYILYPYRASSQKNRSRWQFGVLMPPAYAAADPSETTTARAECVFTRDGEPSVNVVVRFLQVQRRTCPGPGAPDTWDEAVEREASITVAGAALFGDGTATPFGIPGGEEHEATADGEVIRRRQALRGVVTVRATELAGPWQAARLTVGVTNQTAAGLLDSPVLGSPVLGGRAQALPAALVAAHMIITISGGAFVSMTDPPEWAAPAVSECENAGCWPVLAGPAGTRNVLLASPIILPDHPEVASESPGELYDGTEIDEILTLRTLALTDEEKDAARATDPRAAALIDRVESLDGAALQRLHGTIRGWQGSPLAEAREDGDAGEVPWWDPEADQSVSPSTDSVLVAGQRLARGSLVTLRPGARRADAQDMFLVGRTAVVEAVLLDVDDQPYLAVTLTDDPAADLHAAHGRFLYFSPDEVEPA
ncbi:MAG TPA: hypothetical protein VH136_17800 [Trebonia sp.]|nr:hypothetical protein [Trebonia sp.]